MPAALRLKDPIPVGRLVQRRLRELKRTPRELAEAVRVTETYIADLVAGRRRAPAPGSDVYVTMGKFLGLHRDDLPTCARAERAAERPGGRPLPEVRRIVLGLCDPQHARSLERRFARADGAELEWVILARLLEVARGFVSRQLDDEVGLRVSAGREGRSYLDARMRLLEFLDVVPDSLTAKDCEDFVSARIAAWEIDIESRAMKIQLRS
ncbi:MAG TPA: helix-turn-helix transcriptional regulator [Gemmatimonadales bacterium]|nr:helix-turn-helix transcriptional regulator [Gemmatimonadales bacterium]